MTQNSSLFGKLFVAAGTIGAIAMAAPQVPNQSSAVPTTTAKVTTPSAADSKFIGVLEARPTWSSKAGSVHTENTLEGGYQFNPNLKVTYVQWFNTNLFPSDKQKGQGVNLVADDGLFRVRWNNILTSDDKLTSFSFQGRVYLPTEPGQRDAGMVTKLRTYFKVAHEFSPWLSVDFSEAPTLFAYTRPGSGSGAAAAANPIFDNMFILNADVKLTKSLTLSVPVILNLTRFQNYAAGAANNDTWTTTLWIWPELAYEIGGPHTLGLAYRSANFVAPGLGVGQGFERGVTQLFWTVSL